MVTECGHRSRVPWSHDVECVGCDPVFPGCWRRLPDMVVVVEVTQKDEVLFWVLEKR